MSKISATIISICLFSSNVFLATSVRGQTPQSLGAYEDQFTQFHQFQAAHSASDRMKQLENSPNLGAKNVVLSYESVAGRLSPQDYAAFVQALKAVFMHEYFKSVPLFTQILLHKPRYWPALYERASAFSHFGKSKEAIADLTLLLKDHPKFWYCLTLRAYCYFQLNQYEKGIADCTESIALAPPEPVNYRNRAMALRRLHRDTEALADERRAEELQMPLTYTALVEQGRFSAALQVLNRYIAITPRDDVACSQRACLLLALTKYQDAVEACNKLVELFPVARPYACSLRARAYENLGDYEKATQDFEVAIKACESLAINAKKWNPANPPSIYILFMQRYYLLYIKQQAVDYIRLRQLPQALADCNKLLKLMPRNADFYSLRADVFAASGKTDEALKDIRQAIKLDPKSKYLDQQAETIAKSGHLKIDQRAH